MDPVTMIGAIASVVQLVDFINRLTGSIINAIDNVQGFPEEVRRLKLNLQSIRAKLSILSTIFNDPSSKTWLSDDLSDIFKITLLQVRNDVETVTSAIQGYESQTNGPHSLRRRLKYQLMDHKTLETCVRHLESSETGLQRLEASIHFYVTTLVNRNCSSPSSVASVQASPRSVSPNEHRNTRSRASLLCSTSVLRALGFYGSSVDEKHKDDNEFSRTVSFGVCLPSWSDMSSVSVAFNLITASLQDGWTLKWSLRVQCRVSISSPLMKACQAGNVALIRQILSTEGRGINDQTICSGKTPLLLAIYGQHFDAVKCLLEQGADPNIPDDDQVTPLFAVTGMNPAAYPRIEQLPPTWSLWLEAFRLLIKHGASVYDTIRGRNLAGLNIERSDQSSRTLEFLRILANEDREQLDVMSASQRCSALHNALRCPNETVEALRLLHSCGVNLSRIMDDGKTALHLASMAHTGSATLHYLCQDTCGEFINRQDQWGWTPLHYAVVSPSSGEGTEPYSNVIALLDSGADTSIRGSLNSTYIYDQPTESFTAFELLRHVRPARFETMRKVLEDVAVEISCGQAVEPIQASSSHTSTSASYVV